MSETRIPVQDDSVIPLARVLVEAENEARMTAGRDQRQRMLRLMNARRTGELDPKIKVAVDRITNRLSSVLWATQRLQGAYETVHDISMSFAANEHLLDPLRQAEGALDCAMRAVHSDFKTITLAFWMALPLAERVGHLVRLWHHVEDLAGRDLEHTANDDRENFEISLDLALSLLEMRMSDDPLAAREAGLNVTPCMVSRSTTSVQCPGRFNA